MQRRGHQSVTAAVAAVVFALSGLVVIAVAIASQRQPPAAPVLSVAAADSPQPRSTPPAASPQRRGPGRRTHSAVAQRGTAPPVQKNRTPDAAARERVAPARTPPLAPSKPVSITIPAIGVRSVVRHLGQAATGALEVPTGRHYNDAAWYRHSPPPGSLGPAVILGHVDSAAQGPSVFFRLGELRRGNRVTVSRADGSAAVFVVDDVRRYAKKNFPTKLVYSDIDHAGLRILTCGGAFDDAAGSYLDNIVVFASLVGSNP